MDLTPARPKATYEPSVIVQYADGEVSWFLRIVEKELWLYRSADAGEQELSSLIDRRKWKRRKISVEESSRRYVFVYVRIHEFPFKKQIVRDLFSVIMVLWRFILEDVR